MTTDTIARGLAVGAKATLKNHYLFDKMKRLARRADVSNPIDSLPLTAPAAYANSTAYGIGDVIAANGNWYICIIAGTSSASGTGPAFTTTPFAADGTASFAYVSPALVTSSDADAPTISTSNTVPSGPLPNLLGAVTFPGFYRVLGGYSETYSTNYNRIRTFNTKAASPVSMGTAIEFQTDAPSFALGYANGSLPLQIIVDGRRYGVQGFQPATGAGASWTTVTFAKGKKVRTIRVEYRMTDNTFLGLRIDSKSMAWATGGDSIRACFISDSILAGSSYGPFLAGGAFHQRVGHLMGWADCWNFSQGGTGYLNPGTSSYYTYRQRIPEALTITPDVWVPVGSGNDAGYSAAAITAEALLTYGAIRAGSDKPIIALGTWSNNVANLAATEAAIAAAVTQFADPLTFFVPILADATLPWVTGTWNNSANVQSNNGNLFIGGDNVHPIEAGTDYFAQRAANAIKRQVYPLLP